MKVLNNYEDVLNIAKEGHDVVVDLSNMNYIDYTKSIDYIKQMKVMIKKITRSKFMFIYS